MTLLGTATEDEDDDGKKAGTLANGVITKEQLEELSRLINKTKSNVPIFCSLFDVQTVEEMSEVQGATAIRMLKVKAGEAQ